MSTQGLVSEDMNILALPNLESSDYELLRVTIKAKEIQLKEKRFSSLVDVLKQLQFEPFRLTQWIDVDLALSRYIAERKAQLKPRNEDEIKLRIKGFEVMRKKVGDSIVEDVDSILKEFEEEGEHY